MSFALQGVIPPVTTIMTEAGRFDPAGMARHLDHLIASAVDGLLILGSAGEFAQLSLVERKEIAAFCLKHVAGRKPVIIGAGACATAEVIEIGRHAAEHGADAVMVVNSYYTKVSDDRVYGHYKRIGESVPAPVLLYNFPALTGHDLSIELVRRIALDCPNIVGIKDTVDCMSHLRRLVLEVKGARPDFLVFAGYDEYMLDTLILGGDGGIPSSANFAPAITCGIYAAFKAGDFATIRALMGRLAILQALLIVDTPFVGPVKEAIRLVGVDIPTGVALPATPPDAATKAKVAETLKAAGII
jgi:4-hydroxy-tetrahydrodipicolinate synthase